MSFPSRCLTLFNLKLRVNWETHWVCLWVFSSSILQTNWHVWAVAVTLVFRALWQHEQSAEAHGHCSTIKHDMAICQMFGMKGISSLCVSLDGQFGVTELPLFCQSVSLILQLWYFRLFLICHWEESDVIFVKRTAAGQGDSWADLLSLLNVISKIKHSQLQIVHFFMKEK